MLMVLMKTAQLLRHLSKQILMLFTRKSRQRQEIPGESLHMQVITPYGNLDKKSWNGVVDLARNAQSLRSWRNYRDPDDANTV